MNPTKSKINLFSGLCCMFTILVAFSACKSNSGKIPAAETSGEFTHRMLLAKDRLTESRYKPVFTADFILADVNINPDDPRRFDNYSGDLSGRYIEVLSGYLQHGSNAFLDSIVTKVISYQQADGRFGDPTLVFIEDSITKNHMPLFWGNGRLLVGLLEYYDHTGNKDVLNSAIRLGDFFLKSYGEVTPKVSQRLIGKGAEGIICFTQYVEPLVRLSKITGEAKYAEAAIKVYATLPLERGTLHSHGYQTTLRGVLDLYEYDKNPVHFNYVKNAFDDMVLSNDFTIYGSVKEFFGNRGKRDEGCATADFIQLSLHLYKLTHDISYLERAEFALYNELYFNQYFTGDFGHHPFDKAGSVSPIVNAAWWCCTMSGLRTMQIMQDNYFVESSKENTKLNLYLDTHYSGENFEFTLSKGNIINDFHTYDIHINKSDGLKQPFLLRKPSWISDAKILLNNKEIKCPVTDGYFVVSDKLNSGDLLQVRMKYQIKLITPDKKSIMLSDLAEPITATLCYGPCLMGVDNKTDFTFLSEPNNNIVYSHTVANAAGNDSISSLYQNSFVKDNYLTANYKHGSFPSFYQTIFRPVSEMTFDRHPYMMISMRFVPESALQMKNKDKTLVDPWVD